MKKDRAVSKNFSSALKYWREKRNLTLQDLSEVTGISTSYINRLENFSRKAPSVPITTKIARALDIPITTLLDISEDQDNEEMIPTLSELILSNNFTVDEKIIEGSVKEALVELLEYFAEVSYDHVDKLKYLVEVADLIDKFKEGMRAS